MDKLSDLLSAELFSGTDYEYFSFWSLRVIVVVEGKEIHGEVQGIEDEPTNENANTHVWPFKEIQMTMEAIDTFFVDQALRVIHNARFRKVRSSFNDQHN